MGGFTKPILFNSVSGQRILRLLLWTVFALFVLSIAAILFPVYASARVAAKRTTNLMNLKALSVACGIYEEKNDDRFPLAVNWYDATEPYLDVESPIKDPWQSENDFGYAMNAGLSGKRLEDIANPDGTILFYETKRSGKNQSSPGSKIPLDAFARDGTYVSFTDGSKRRLYPKQLLKASQNPDDFKR